MTTTILRPDGVKDATGCTVTGAANAALATSDNSDSSYVLIPTNAHLQLGLTGVTLPAGALTRWVQLRVRGRMVTTAGEVTVRAFSSIAPYQTAGAGRLHLTTAITDNSVAPVSATYSQNEIDALNFDFTNYGFDMRVMEVYLDLTYALIPTVAVTAPAGPVTDTSSPTVTWTYTQGSDGGPQTRAQVRVFSAAQYAAPGFDPTLSVPVYDSGEVLGTATSAVAGPVDNLTTYRFYVRAAQTINGVAQWSAWAYNTANIALSAPVVDSVLPTAEVDTARIRLVVTRGTGSGVGGGDPLTDENGDTLTIEDGSALTVGGVGGGGPNIAWDALDIQRSDDNGVTWVPVRGATQALPYGDVWISYDYEAPNGLNVLYRARGLRRFVGSWIVGDWTVSPPVGWTSTDSWLKHPYMTSLNQVVRLYSQPGFNYGVSQAVFHPIGNPNPIVVSDIRYTPTGNVAFLTFSDAEAAKLLPLLNRTDALLLQLPSRDQFGSRYVVMGSLDRTRAVDVEGEPTWIWQTAFVEVQSPPDVGVQIAGFDWQDVIDQFTTWQDVLNRVTTWGALL